MGPKNVATCMYRVESFKIDIETFVTIPVSTNPFWIIMTINKSILFFEWNVQMEVDKLKEKNPE